MVLLTAFETAKDKCRDNFENKYGKWCILVVIATVRKCKENINTRMVNGAF